MTGRRLQNSEYCYMSHNTISTNHICTFQAVNETVHYVHSCAQKYHIEQTEL